MNMNFLTKILYFIFKEIKLSKENSKLVKCFKKTSEICDKINDEVKSEKLNKKRFFERMFKAIFKEKIKWN